MPEHLDSTQADIANLSFEDALAELERIVRQIEDGRGRLDEAISSYERGIALKRHCESKLKDARVKVQQITLTEDGADAVPFGG